MRAATSTWLSLWGGFVLALLVARAIAGESVAEIGDLFFGIPLAWLAAWLTRHQSGLASLASGVVLVGAGFAIGLLN